MPLIIIRNDITRVKADAIVNAANSSLLGGGGVDGAIHRAAGPELLAECRTLGGCGTGQAKITKGYRLPCKYVIHTVGPIWQGGDFGERGLLEACYRSSLELAKEHGCESVAFPVISSGAYGYPPHEAFAVAAETIRGFLSSNDMTVYLVVFNDNVFLISRKLFDDVRQFIDDNYVEEYDSTDFLHAAQEAFHALHMRGYDKAITDNRRRSVRYDEMFYKKAPPAMPSDERLHDDIPLCDSIEAGPPPCAAPRPMRGNLDDALAGVGESFREMLLRKIDESGMKPSQCYRRANVDGKLFSKLRNNKLYNPSKQIVLAFVLALRLSPEEADTLLMKAGYAFSDADKTDIIVRYFIEHGEYDIDTVNAVLYQFDRTVLGGNRSDTLEGLSMS